MNDAGGRTVTAIGGFICVLALHLCVLSPRNAAASDEKPSFAVFLEKRDVRENDSVRVHFQVTNGGSPTIAMSSITMISPGNFIQWHCGGCTANSKAISAIDVGRIDPHQSVDREVWFHTGPDVPL